MNSVRIVADNGCDLPPSLAARYNVTLVPLVVRFGQETVWDADLTEGEFWVRAARSGQIPGTAAPPPSMFQNAFRQLVEDGHDVLCLTLPADFSAIFNTACLAAEEFGQRVRVLDSGSMTLGMGLLALAAAKQSLAGLSLDAVCQAAESLRQRISVIFALDTLEWVRRGGRLERLLPLIDRMTRTFHVKPVIELANGEFHLLGVARSYRAVLQRIEDEVKARMPAEALCTAYTLGREAGIELAGRLSGLAAPPESELGLLEAGPVFAAHAGRNAVGAALIRA